LVNENRNDKAKLEGCIALGYMYDEALGFCIKYFALYLHTTCRIWDVNEEEANAWEFLYGNGALKWLSPMEMEMIHSYVIVNFVATKALYKFFLCVMCWWKT
jgi:hypothetical protein